MLSDLCEMYAQTCQVPSSQSCRWLWVFCILQWLATLNPAAPLPDLLHAEFLYEVSLGGQRPTAALFKMARRSPAHPAENRLPRYWRSVSWRVDSAVGRLGETHSSVQTSEQRDQRREAGGSRYIPLSQRTQDHPQDSLTKKTLQVW